MKVGAYLLILFSVFAFIFSAVNLYAVYSHPIKYKSIIEENALTNNLNPALVASVINVESSFNKNAKSSKGAVGLMQIKLSTANYINSLNQKENINEVQLFDVDMNIELGCEYLKYLTKKFKDINTVLAAYNAGETVVRGWLNSGIYSIDNITLNYIPYEETRNYVEKINKNIYYYKKIFK